METKTYVIQGKTLTQSELSLNDMKKVLVILKDIDWEVFNQGDKTLYEIVSNYLDEGVLEQVIDIVLKGDRPKGNIGDWLPASVTLEVVTDFFKLNASLKESMLSLLSNFQLSQTSEKTK